MINKLFFLCFISILTIGNIAQANNSYRDSYADIVAPLLPAVVNISTTQKHHSSSGGPRFPEGSPFEEFNRFLERFGQMPGVEEDERPEPQHMAAGSGFIISGDGYIVTNHHVIEHAEKITVTLSNKQKLDAKLIGSDSRTDLALLKVESKTALPFVKFGDSDKSRVGDFIIAIGNPFGLGSTVTSGIISAQARDINTFTGNIVDNFIQTDAAINQGNSGGPMFNLNGEVIGINFAIFSPSGGSVGVGFAVPSSAAKPIIDQLVKTGKIHHGWLGVAVQSTHEVAESFGLVEDTGALVAAVTAGGPAEKAGIQVGDIILKFDGKEVSSSKKLPRIVAETPIGKEVVVGLLSKGKHKEMKITVGEYDVKSKVASADVASDKEIYGMHLSALTPGLKQKYGISDKVSGVIVLNMERKGVAAKHGIKKGDIISSVNQQVVNSSEEFIKLINEAKKNQRKSVMLMVSRAEHVIFINLPISDDKK